jgi:hypothetical protein
MRRFIRSLSLLTWLFAPFAFGAFAGAIIIERLEVGITANGRHVDGTVIELIQRRTPAGRSGGAAPGVMEYYLRFSYPLEDDTRQIISKRVSSDFQKRYKVGDGIHVRYLPDNPAVVEVEFADYADGASALRAFGWLFLLIILIDVIRVGFKLRRNRGG